MKSCQIDRDREHADYLVDRAVKANDEARRARPRQSNALEVYQGDAMIGRFEFTTYQDAMAAWCAVTLAAGKDPTCPIGPSESGLILLLKVG